MGLKNIIRVQEFKIDTLSTIGMVKRLLGYDFFVLL